MLIHDQTGRHTRLNVPHGCGLGPIAMGGSWLLFACGGQLTGAPPPLKLYRLSSPRRWRDLPRSPQLDQQCTTAGVSCTPTAIGNHWIEYAVSGCFTGVHCQSASSEFQNIDTGQLAANPAAVGGTVIPDLNSPTLARKLCSPLRVPSAGQTEDDPGPLPGTFTMYGRFAVSSEATVGDPGTGSAYLQKCGSRLDQQLSYSADAQPLPAYAPPVGNTHVIVWAAGVGLGQVGRQLNAVLLPGLRRLVIPVPAAIGASSTLVLGPHHLYMIGTETGDLYTIPTQALTSSPARP